MLVCQTSSNEARWTQGERLEHIFEHLCDGLAAAGQHDKVAIQTDAQCLTFNELDGWANRLARHLKARGVKPGDRLGLIFDRTVETYVALLAALKVQAAYVPLDASFPIERIAFILEDAAVSAVLTMSAFKHRVSDTNVTTILVDDEASAIDSFSSERMDAEERGQVQDDLCYVIYTSGTTGKPKGVAIDHASICNFVRVANEVYRYTDTDRVYQGMTIAFDFSVEELWVPLLAGATLVPGPPGTNLVGDELASYLRERHISALCCVPTLLATIENDLPDLRFILVSGEACPQNLVERWSRPERRMVNAYGPTEATVTATVTELTAGKQVTIGTPLPTYTIVILDVDRDETVADGEMGEIAIAGIGLAREYLNRPDLTARKFVADVLQIPNNPSGRIYRTGDLGRITPAGEVEFHGRIDTQVKIRGYRIELAEIEALIETMPEISQAVVNPHEQIPGSPDLVAYFTLKAGFEEPRAEAIIELLRTHLPRYMIPAFIERLSAIPMTLSNKVDRKALPPPARPRVALSSTAYVAPRSELEKLVATVLCDTLGIERVSLKDHFFQDLGGHSLVMARFCSQVRRMLVLPSISMRDVYQHPTIESLCRRIADLESERFAEFELPEPHTPSRFAYLTCGTAQILTYTGFTVVAFLFLEYLYFEILAPGYDLRETAVRITLWSIGLFVGYTSLAVLAKWLLIGRWKPGAIPVWGLHYFRIWFANLFVRSAPPLLFPGTPIYNIYLRLLGARIGTNTVIRAKSMPLCTDLVSIGSNTIVRANSLLATHTAENNRLHFGSIELGSDVVVGEGSIVCQNTRIAEGGQLGHASSLQSGQMIPAGTRYHGSPAQETHVDFRLVDERACSWLRRTLYGSFLLTMGFSFVSAGVLIFYYIFWLLQVYATDVAPQGMFGPDRLARLVAELALLTLLLMFVGLLLGLATSFVLPRLLNKLLRTDRTYVNYGFHFIIQGIISAISAAPFFNLLFGDSSAIVYYLRLAGYRLKKVIQTGANFGLDLTQDNPLLCEVGTGTMVSDGLLMVNGATSPTSFKLERARIGDNNYLGNYIIFPWNAKTDDDCLLATKVMLPIDGSVRRGVGLLGSPSFEIPRSVDRDTCFKVREVDQRLLARKNKVNATTIALLLLSIWFYGTIALLALHLTFRFYSGFGIWGVISVAYALMVFTILYLVFVERASLGFGRLQSRIVSMYDPYFLFHERHWKFCATPLQHLFAGTPLRNVMCRMLGVKLGKMVYNDGCQFYDKTLIEVGDYANLNAFSMFQAHSLEEGVFKSDRVKVGNRCTVGANALIHYGVETGDGVIVQPDSFIMKGEVLDAATIWCGNPAKVAGRIRIEQVTSEKSAASSEAGVAACARS